MVVLDALHADDINTLQVQYVNKLLSEHHEIRIREKIMGAHARYLKRRDVY